MQCLIRKQPAKSKVKLSFLFHQFYELFFDVIWNILRVCELNTYISEVHDKNNKLGRIIPNTNLNQEKLNNT